MNFINFISIKEESLESTKLEIKKVLNQIFLIQSLENYHGFS